jgi:hypothetical protein
MCLFWSKIAIYLSLVLLKGRSSCIRSRQPSKNEIYYLFYFCGSFFPPRSGSTSMVNGNTVECFSCGINPVKNGLLVGMFESGFFVGFFVHFSLLDPGPNHWLMFVLKKVHFMRLNTVESGLLVGMFDCPVSLLGLLDLRRVVSDLLEDDARISYNRPQRSRHL